MEANDKTRLSEKTQESVQTEAHEHEWLQGQAIAALTVGQLTWLRFRKSRPAVYSLTFLILLYLAAALAPFLAPYGVRTTHAQYPGAPPHPIRFVDVAGRFHLRPFVYGLERKVDPKTFQSVFSEDTTKVYMVRFFARGEQYKLLGLFNWDRHLFLVDEPGKVFLLGTDRQGRDLFSRILFGSQISLTVGLLGVFISLALGSFFGLMSGLYGGVFDMVMQRVVEVMLAFPQIPLWMALAAAVPANWSSVKVFFGVTIVLSLVNWASLARQVRAKALSLREQDFVVAARLSGATNLRIITRHLFPNIISHVLVVATLSVPGMILGETALSFLGLGIRPPMTSWGVLLSEAQQTRVLLQQPWLVTPALFVIATVLAFNFVGDGLRDAADPYSR
jgi:peptide/nickel transport system permease protein